MKNSIFVVLLTAVFVLIFMPVAPAGVKPIVLGVPTPLTYPHGKDSLVAVKMASEEINARGGVFVKEDGVKRPFKVVAVDTRAAAPGVPVHDAIMAYERLILKEKPDFLVGCGFRSEIVITALDLLAKYKIPYLEGGGSMSPSVNKKVVEDYDSYKYYFRFNLNAVHLIKGIIGSLVTLSKEFGFKRAYIVVEDTLITRQAGKIIEKILKGQGWEIVGHDRTPLGATDYSPTLIKAKAAKAQVIVPFTSLPETSILAKQMYDMKVPAMLVGYLSPIISERAWETSEGKVAWTITYCGEIGPLATSKLPKTVEFVKKLTERLGHPTDSDKVSSAYDSIFMLAEAIERAGTLKADKIISELEKTDYMGVNGRYRFGKDHQAIYGSDPAETCIGGGFQWVNGKRVLVFPKAVTEGKIQLPPWMK